MKYITLYIILFSSFIITAQTATIKGVIKDATKKPIEGVTISALKNGAISNKNGEYELVVQSGTTILITFKHITFNTLKKEFLIPNKKTLRYSPILSVRIEKIDEVIIENRKKDAEGFISVNPENISKIPGANKGIENILMTLPGVNNNNELSTQYNVRGGNFDENLVYVNGIEVYRPFLVRSGQQEGLSFVNGAMVQNINFSAGGFQAKYGDKLSSVLDITYRTPKKYATSMSASLLGGSLTFEGISPNKKLSALLGFRYRDNSLFINSKDIETNSNPNFTDIQTFLTYNKNSKLKFEFLGNFTLNNYNYTPKTRRTKFGTLSAPLELIVYYQGQEKDKFKTLFGAIKSTYTINQNLDLSLSSSAYSTVEEEYFDILASYNIGEVNNNFGSEDFGKVKFSEGIGSQLNHARNDIDALISNIEFKGTYKKKNHKLDFGIKYQYEDIKDRIKEWEVIDSVGFSVRPLNEFNNNQPYESFSGELTPFQSVSANNKLKIDRFVWFTQFSNITDFNNHKLWYTIGIRSHNWNVKGNNLETVNKIIYSVRGQIAIKPDWKKDMLFRFSGGMYNQPPSYKELRNSLGKINSLLDTQKSFQTVIGNDYSFNIWNRPFKLISEIYYKSLTNVNVYTLDNVRIRYRANNNAKAYATGVDLRLNGEFVPGTESWVSIGFLKTEENYNNKGYISRPTDQRFKFAMLFQDYVPNIPKIKMYLNLVFNTGLPGGAPSYSDAYQYQGRLNSYKRADIGISYILKDINHHGNQKWLDKFNELTIGFEIYNMFDVQNSITNTWVRDSYSKRFYGVSNYMTPRLLNIKMNVSF